MIEQITRACAIARSHMIQDMRWFGQLAMRLRVHVDDEVERAATDGINLWLSPAWFLGLDFEQQKGVFADAVAKSALGHPGRRGGRDAQEWAVASSQAVQPLLTDSGVELPADYPRPPAHLRGHLAEEIYRYNSQPQPGGKEGNDSDNGEEGEDGDAGGGGQGTDADGDDFEGHGSQGESGQGGAATDSSGPSGADSGPDQTDGGGYCEVVDPTESCHSANPRPGDGERLDQQEIQRGWSAWEMASMNAEKMASRAGCCPGAVTAVVNEMVNPIVDWRDLLRVYLTMTQCSDYSWTRPNRRYLSSGFLMPSLASEGLSEIVVVFDTSGSIRMPEYRQFIAELNSILEEFDALTHLYYVDTELAVPRREVTREDIPIPPEFPGGGGTRFSPAFLDMEQEGIDPDVVIYLTDMKCSEYAPEPGCDVLWISTTKEEHLYSQPPYGEVVFMPVI